MLYVHMAVLLNELFFPKADPHTAALFAAFAYCSTYVLRPFGALIFGYLGDTIGRKHTVIITTLLMSLSCIVYGQSSNLCRNRYYSVLDSNNNSYDSRYIFGR